MVTFANLGSVRLPSLKFVGLCVRKIRRIQCVSVIYTVVQKNAPTLADYNYDAVQSILIIFSKLFVNDHKSCLVVKFSTSPHICCHYTL